MFVHSSGPAGLQLRPVLLKCLNSIGTTASFSSLSKARVHYVLARPRYVCYVLYVPYLNHPLYAISCRPLPYTLCLPPPQSHRRRKGDLSILTTIILTVGYIVLCFRYLLCLGPSQALSKGYHSLKGDKENHRSQSRLLGIQQLMASNRILRGRSPQGLGGAVYLLIYLQSPFINIRSLMLSIRGQRMLSNTIYLYWIVQVP